MWSRVYDPEGVERERRDKGRLQPNPNPNPNPNLNWRRDKGRLQSKGIVVKTFNSLLLKEKKHIHTHIFSSLLTIKGLGPSH